MRAFFLLLGREVHSTVCSFGFYVLLAGVMGITAYKFQEALEITGYEMNSALMRGWGIPLILTAVVAPLLTMRLFAEEKRSGSYELLMTAPVTDLQVVLAKFTGAALIYVSFVSPFWLIHGVLSAFFDATPDWGLLASMTVGLLLLGMVFLSIGTLASALTSFQLWAALLAFLGNIVLWLLGQAYVLVDPESSLFPVIVYINLDSMLRTSMSGIIDFRHVVYAVSLTAFFLFVTIRVVEGRRWR